MQDLGNGIQIILEEPNLKTNSAVILVPGISGEALTDKYRKFSDAVLKSGYASMRLQSWHNPADFEVKTPNIILDDIRKALDFLEGSGYTNIIAVGKSFGGAMLLIKQDPRIKKLILWSPALFVVPTDGTLVNYLNLPLAQAKSPKDITVDFDFLKRIQIPVRLIHGTADHLVPIENSRLIQQNVPDATLEAVEGIEHSWKTNAEEEIIIKTIAKYFDI